MRKLQEERFEDTIMQWQGNKDKEELITHQKGNGLVNKSDWQK